MAYIYILCILVLNLWLHGWLSYFDENLKIHFKVIFLCFEGFEKYSCYLKSFFHLKKIYTFYKNISLLGFFLESWSDSIGTAIIKPKIQIFLNNFLCIEDFNFFWIWQIYIILWCIYIYQIYFNATLYYNKKSF